MPSRHAADALCRLFTAAMLAALSPPCISAAHTLSFRQMAMPRFTIAAISRRRQSAIRAAAAAMTLMPRNGDSAG